MKKLGIIMVFVASLSGHAQTIVKTKGAIPQQNAVGSCKGLPTCQPAADGKEGYATYPCCIRTNLPGTGGTQM